jgi:hypothetical protein
VVTALGEGALVALSAVAVPLGAPREVLHLPGWMKSPRPDSFIVRTGHYLPRRPRQPAR